ncbi:hypothetical protein G7Y89_g4346 [Cudoniella acicularis]|uniref:CID domain-containing protein n=1 Tax=Cudoniella acicularis TaxID=354080 RepID=A0A8H4RRT5_9HELO|nr:hypothetical protein G7Y89_g4346 [Cudoniella acicularis]
MPSTAGGALAIAITVKSFWVGWGALCVAGGGAYYFAKKSINEDRMARFEADRRRRQMQESLEYSARTSSQPVNGNGGPARADSSGSPSQEATLDPAPTTHAPESEGQRVREKSNGSDAASKREPSIKRKRLHLLYLVNDILYHGKYRVNDASICGKVQPILVNLLGSAASFKACPKHQRKISDLLTIWEEKDYYSKEYIAKLREAVKNASEFGEVALGEADASTEGGHVSTTKLAKSAPFVMPAMHGDSTTPWFDLPAGNLMPHIVPNSTRPINPDMIKPMQFVAGPASEELVLAVKALLDDVQIIYGNEIDGERDERASWDIDELGQPIMLDEITGDVLEGEGYYGWSRTFCEKMKRRKKGLDKPGHEEHRVRRSVSGSRSRSRSSSRGRKRPRSDSESSREGYRSTRRRRTRSYSSSRSPTPENRRNGNSRPRSRSQSYSRSPQRSSSPRRMEPYPKDSRPPHDPLPSKPPQPLNQPPPIPPSQFQQGFNPNFPPPPPPPFNGSAPPFGQWPPPPPMHFNPQNPWPVPPPPPGNPPPINYQQGPGGFPPAGPGAWQQQQQGDGRGYNNPNNNWNNNGGYRGGRGNYRGRGW